MSLSPLTTLLHHCFTVKKTTQPILLESFLKAHFPEVQSWDLPPQLVSVVVFDLRDRSTFCRDLLWRLEEIVDQCIASFMSTNIKSVICLGYSQGWSYFPGGTSLVSPFLNGIECYCPNAAVRFLKLPCWHTVLDRAGDEFMRYLISNTVMLAREGKVWVQISGPMLPAALSKVGTDLLCKKNPSMYINTAKASIKYSLCFSKGKAIPSKHILNNCTGRSLTKYILKAYPLRKEGKTVQKDLRLWATGLARNHNRCPYRKLLRQYCPRKSSTSYADAMVYAIPWKNVSSFLKDACLRLLPKNTFPSPKSKRLFLKSIQKLVRDPYLSKIHFENIGICIRKTEWTFKEIILPLLRSSFYCSEISGDSEIHYWHKRQWFDICKTAILKLCNDKKLTPVPAVRKESCSKIRFLSKKSGGLRPIINCRAANYKLSFEYQALKSAFIHRESQKKNSRKQILGLNEFYPLYKAFVKSFKSAFPSGHHAVAMVLDVEQCFDNIEHNKLKECVDELLESNEYRVDSYSCMFINKHIRRARSVTKRDVTWEEHENNIRDIFDRVPHTAPETLLVDRAEFIVLNKDSILEKVNQHISRHFVRFASEKYRLIKGIPQGSILSSLLCTLYFDKFETEYVDDILFKEPTCPSFCIRLLDDYLVISSDKSRVSEFQKLMTEKKHRFSISVNQTKTDSTDKHSTLSWCGYCINFSVGAFQFSVSLDEERIKKADSKSTLSVGKFAVRKIFSQLIYIYMQTKRSKYGKVFKRS